MAVLKCKMCGGDLVLEPEQTVVECEYCGSKQTVPVADDEKKLKLFDRAGRLLRNCEFDKAAGVFESIVAENPQEAEAYWGLLLCRYGIEYVDDPATGKKIPTCHRSSFTSILDDKDFELVMENADAVARRVYREEAKAIEELRKRIIEVSAKEDPYDIFICYKETDENGQRTLDSVLAQDLYDVLTDKGYRVFFARITLEDKLGQEYEPYIFAALHSAKIMLAIGTDYEYYNAIWVKNEWSRFLQLIAAGEKKSLIPCYKNIDAYDMPKEFAKLQAQDLGKVGATQDLLRGIEKVLPRQKAEKESVVIQQVAGANIAALLKRGEMALEDYDWKKADAFFEEVLNLNAECAEAYLGKALAEVQCATITQYVDKRLADNEPAKREAHVIAADWARVDAAIQAYSMPGYLEEDEIRALYRYEMSYQSDVYSCNRKLELERKLWNNNRNLVRAEQFALGTTASTIRSAKDRFFKELKRRVEQAVEEKAESEKQKKQRYSAHLDAADQKAMDLWQQANRRREKDYESFCIVLENSVDPHALRSIAQEFEKLGEYSDSRDKAKECNEKAARLEQKKEAERRQIEAELEAKRKHQEELQRAAAEERKRQEEAERAAQEAERERQRAIAAKLEAQRKARNKVITIATIAAVVAVIIVAMVITNSNKRKAYQAAVVLFDAGNYAEALTTFQTMRDYEASQSYIDQIAVHQENKAAYDAATEQLNDKRFRAAEEAFRELGDFEDSPEMAQEAKYQRLCALLELWGEYHLEIDMAQVYILSEKSEGYADFAMEEIPEHMKNEKVLEDAWEKYSSEHLPIICYYQAPTHGYVPLMDYIVAGFAELGDYKDAKTHILDYEKRLEADRQRVYDEATALLDAGDKSGAAKLLYQLGNYSDAFSLLGSLYERITLIANSDCTIGVKADGTVVAVGDNEYGQCDVNSWTDIVGVTSRGRHTVGLRDDGTVIAVGYDEFGQCEVDGWKEIVAVTTGNLHTVGLKADRTVVAVGWNEYGQCDVDDWKEIIAVASSGNHTVGLKADGTVVAVGDNEYGQCDVGSWTDIVAVAVGKWHTVGLKSDGTVVAAGRNKYRRTQIYGQCDVSGWTDIVAIATGETLTVGVKSDGTVVAVGDNEYGQCDVNGWANIVDIIVGPYHTLGLKSDGTVVAAGGDSFDRCNVGDWKDIVAIALGDHHSLGLKSDGTVVAVGQNADGQCDVSDWTDIKLPG